MVFLSAETAFQPGGSFLADVFGQYFTFSFVFACPPFSFEVGADFLAGTIFPVFVGGIDGICSDHVHSAEEPSGHEDRAAQAGTFVEGIEVEPLDKVDSIDLDLVNLGSELHRLDFLASDNRPQVRFAEADDPVLGLVAMVEIGVLLVEDLVNGRTPGLVLGTGLK